MKRFLMREPNDKRRTKHPFSIARLRRMNQEQVTKPLPPPVQDHLIQLLAQGLHVGIGKPRVQRDEAVGVVARSTHFLSRVFSHRIHKKTGFTEMGSDL